MQVEYLSVLLISKPCHQLKGKPQSIDGAFKNNILGEGGVCTTRNMVKVHSGSKQGPQEVVVTEGSSVTIRMDRDRPQKAATAKSMHDVGRNAGSLHLLRFCHTTSAHVKVPEHTHLCITAHSPPPTSERATQQPAGLEGSPYSPHRH